MLLTLGLHFELTTASPVVLFPSGPPGEPKGLVGPETVHPRKSANGYELEIRTNVSVPTITPYLSSKCKGNCPAVLIVSPSARTLDFPIGMVVYLTMLRSVQEVPTRFSRGILKGLM